MKMMKTTRLLPVLLLALSGPLAAETTESPVVATVNGTTLTEEMLQMYSTQRNRNPGAPPISREAALDELINIELVAQDATRKGFDKRPNVVKQLEWQRRSLLVGVGMHEYVADHPITDDEVKKAYDEFLKTRDTHEYHARHILVEKEDEAKAIIAELGKGGDFAKLAEEKSKDPSGKHNGGDLDWFSGKQMVEPFAKAVAKMKPGQTSKQPVQTQFGWHVIKLEETREATAPAFEEIADQLRMQIQNQRVDDYLAELRKGAKIKMGK
ncbi:MAG: peptidylprolyl isomerase [Gammaproteobacteria bacterium]